MIIRLTWMALIQTSNRLQVLLQGIYALYMHICHTISELSVLQESKLSLVLCRIVPGNPL